MNGATGAPAGEREREAEEALLEMGIRAPIIARGAGDIAAIQARPADHGRLMGPEAPAIAARVRAAGFRYVSIELTPADDHSSDAERPHETVPESIITPANAETSTE